MAKFGRQLDKLEKELTKTAEFASKFVTRSTIDWGKTFKSVIDLPDHKVLDWRSERRQNPRVCADFMLQMRPALLNCKVIDLSDDLVWAITRLSTELHPRILMDHALNTRFPFEHMLFTWDGAARHHSYVDLKTPVHNYDPPPPTEFPALIVSSYMHNFKSITDLAIDEGRVIFAPLRFYFDPTKHTEGKARANLMLHKCHADEYSPHSGYWFTHAILEEHPEFAETFDADLRFGTQVTPPLGTYFVRQIREGVEANRKDALHSGVQKLMVSTAGNPRWFGALCALLNFDGPTRVINGFASMPADPHPGAATKRASNQKRAVHNLTTFLPREEVVRVVRGRHLDYDRKKPGNHDVGSFWRPLPNRGDPNCDHQWPEDQGTQRQVCDKCDGVRVRISAHKRGKGAVLTQKRRRLDYGGMSIHRIKTAIENEAREHE
jgi:hypothetical protein